MHGSAMKGTVLCAGRKNDLCVCNRAEDGDKEDAGDSVDLYAEVEETQISGGEDGGDEWSELEGVLEGGGSGKSSGEQNNARAGVDNEMSTSGGGGDKRDESKNKRERGLRKGASAGVQGGTGEGEGEEKMIVQEVVLVDIIDTTGTNVLKRKKGEGGEGNAKKLRDGNEMEQRRTNLKKNYLKEVTVTVDICNVNARAEDIIKAIAGKIGEEMSWR
ncbi:uncharacterized protein LOC131522749 [Onychostoma macrolepis]|uniref:uncharacterized protein LOC131522749 n=1 Tax=Onychostoma macrolepis TaxID=369639 RepID=UPI00272D105A|nr:uncharacterized protein LOC131522749 [Onychostoma macrolepis]